jgi:hypothetical protein
MMALATLSIAGCGDGSTPYSATVVEIQCADIYAGGILQLDACAPVSGVEVINGVAIYNAGDFDILRRWDGVFFFRVTSPRGANIWAGANVTAGPCAGQGFSAARYDVLPYLYESHYTDQAASGMVNSCNQPGELNEITFTIYNGSHLGTHEIGDPDIDEVLARARLRYRLI